MHYCHNEMAILNSPSDPAPLVYAAQQIIASSVALLSYRQMAIPDRSAHSRSIQSTKPEPILRELAPLGKGHNLAWMPHI